MLRHDAELLLPIIKAYSEGKPIEVKYGGIWREITEPIFSESPDCYRIKTEPKVLFVLLSGDGSKVSQPMSDQSVAEERLADFKEEWEGQFGPYSLIKYVQDLNYKSPA